MPKIQSSSNGMYVNLPREYMQLLGWRKGDLITCYPSSEEKQVLLMKKVADASPETKRELSPNQKIHIEKMRQALKAPAHQEAPAPKPAQPNTTILTRPANPINSQQSQPRPTFPQQLSPELLQKLKQMNL